jgi:hypothetical protein
MLIIDTKTERAKNYLDLGDIVSFGIDVEMIFYN